MASREELLIIRAARAGQASAQLKLGKRYLFGGAGLPKSLPTALYWLDRAAQQDEEDAWMLIGSHVPFETAQQAAHPSKLYVWYERAFDAGIAQAGLVLAKLVLGQVPGAVSDAMRNKALRALQSAAHAGIPEAQWMLAQWMSHPDATPVHDWSTDTGLQATDNEAMLEWAKRAARSGVVDAQYALAEHAWASGDHAAFVQWALPLARDIAGKPRSADAHALEHDANLLLRCARSLLHMADYDAVEVARFLEFAAQAGHCEAQLAYGLWLARIDERGDRLPAPGAANYKKAIRWLMLAAGQQSAQACYALSKICHKPEYSHRSRTDALRYTAEAAYMGHARAQFEYGVALWRARREAADNDVLAVGWLQKALAQGVTEAGRMLAKIASRAEPAEWAAQLLQRLPEDAVEKNPLLAARLRLAALMGLDRTETLLIDPNAADRGHCLVVDVRAQHPHSKRRVVLVEDAEQRQALDRIRAVFEHIDCGPHGPEGNYRQRLYRLKTLAGE